MKLNQIPTTKMSTNWVRRAWQFLTEPDPTIQEIGERRRAQLLSVVSLILLASFLWALSLRPQTNAAFVILLAVSLAAYTLSRTKYYSAGAYLFTFGFTAQAYLTIRLGTANSIESAVFSFVPITLIIASALLPQGGFLILAVTTVLATFGAQFYSTLPPSATDNITRTGGVVFSMAAVLYGINIFRANIERARLREVQEINWELVDIRSGLEQRVEERTRELETANLQMARRASQLQAITELSTAIAQLQDINELFPTAANLISERFGFYHVGIFLVDSQREFAMLQAANSEGGRRMLGRGHRLKLGAGVVGYVAQTGEPRIALDVGTDAVFFDNPDLPETRSEAALPLKLGGKTIGVLDVQSTEAGAFTAEDLQVLTGLANQVTIALENARLLTETRAALTQVQEVYNEFTRAEWSRAMSKLEQRGFRYRTGRIEMLKNALQDAEVLSAARSGNITANQPNGAEEKRASVAVPVKLRGEVIGVLHVESNDPEKTWREDEVSLIQAVAERAAFALENARLFQDARRRAAKERMISEAATRIGSALNLENILHATAEELERVLGGSEVLIQFKSKETS